MSIKDISKFSDEVAQKNLSQSAEFKDEYCDCMAVSVDEAAFDGELDREVAIALEKLPGRYWLAGYIGGSAVFKQEKPDDVTSPNSHELVLWMKDDGWYISNVFGDSTDTPHSCSGFWGVALEARKHTKVHQTVDSTPGGSMKLSATRYNPMCQSSHLGECFGMEQADDVAREVARAALVQETVAAHHSGTVSSVVGRCDEGVLEGTGSCAT